MKVTGATGKSKRWQFMTVFRIGDYLTRLRIVQTPAFGIYLHKIKRPDKDQGIHDHPWSFVSIILLGSYYELRRNPVTMEKEVKFHRWLNVVRKHDQHRILRLTRPTVWSLMLVGRRYRTWGYWYEGTTHGIKYFVEFDNERGIELLERILANNDLNSR